MSSWEFGTTTTLESRREAEEYGQKVAEVRGWEFVRAERQGPDWTPVWRYPEEDARAQ